MKKFIAILLSVLMLLSVTALADATYRREDLTFTYDDAAFKIATEDETDDELQVVLAGQDAAWGQTSIQMHLADIRDGEKFPTLADFAEMDAASGSKTEQLDTWANFKNVFTYSYTTDDVTTTVFIAPVYDDDGEIEDNLTVTVEITKLDDEQAAMTRDDLISNVLNTLKVVDD